MADPKKRSGFVLPQIIDPPRKCVKIWIPNEVYHRGAFWGAIFELTQAFNWQQDPPEKARAVANLWFDIWSEATEDNNMTTCCDDVQVILRVNPETGVIEQSSNGGTSWTPQAGGFPSVIVNPVPPVTSGVAATKCDAATNVSGQVQAWIDQVSNDFTTATTLLEFGQAVIVAIAGAVLVVLTGGALAPVEALALAALGAALTAAWGAGKAVFDAYWTTDVKDKILCAAFCTIGDDGSFTDAQFSQFWNKVNSDIPASPAKMLFMGFLSSVGTSGLNAMAASGLSADADCSDCVCFDDCAAKFSIWDSANNGSHGAIIERGDGYLTAEAGDGGNGNFYIILHTNDMNECCVVPSMEVQSGSFGGSLTGWTDCGVNPDEGAPQHTGLFSGSDCVNYLQLQAPQPFTMKITFAPCP